jgi:hypothetical protein
VALLEVLDDFLVIHGVGSLGAGQGAVVGLEAGSRRVGRLVRGAVESRGRGGDGRLLKSCNW